MKRISLLYFAEKRIMRYSGYFFAGLVALVAALLAGCNKLDDTGVEAPVPEEVPAFVSLPEVAQLLAAVPLEAEHLEEVHRAALTSAGNGYDEEYRMKDLFAAPGTGVGEEASTKAADAWRHPLREALREALLGTKASDGEASAWLDSLALSDVQIYWPGSEDWDGSALPVITYDPGEGATRNEGYALQPDGSVKKVMVDEQMTLERPVWVVNRNSDAEYKSLELLRREDPSWGTGGGDILVKSAQDPDLKSLVLRSLKTKRQYDSWFAGASEFFVKIGAIENFVASTEAELRLYDPTITDFMIVVRRKQMGQEVPFNAVLVSEWSQQLTSCALMIVEDDGGTRNTWKCSAVVKVESKSYGVELELPLYSRDDIVWRGSLSRRYLEKYSGQSRSYGDVDLVMELM